MNEPTQHAPDNRQKMLKAVNCLLLLEGATGVSAEQIMATIEPFIADAEAELAREVMLCKSERQAKIERGDMMLQAEAERDVLRGQVAVLLNAIPYPGLTAGAAEAIAFEIECGKEAKSTIPPEAKSKWLRYLASKLRAFEIAATESVPPIPDPSDTLDSRGVAEDERNPVPPAYKGRTS